MSTIFHVSDLHFGAEDVDALTAFTGAVHAEAPDAVVITGDLTMRARSSEFAAATAWLTGLGVPLSIEVGNHDIPYYFNPLLRAFRPYARYERLEAALERPLAAPDFAIVPLRTTARAQWRLNWASGRVSQARLNDAVAALRTLPENRVRIVACHHPLTGAPEGMREGRTRGGRAALAMLAAAGADLVLSGHVHDPFDLIWAEGVRPIRMVGAGTLSERVRASPPSYNRIVIDGTSVTVDAIKI